ncbi:hypothetical protein ACIQYL_03530 [Lysinibacillus xylanilyticus]|uniref:hypothetical protein n=1 Tax=Lysinibacillus xylanilyticus TaxID=582475 RepID=UPI0037FBB82F
MKKNPLTVKGVSAGIIVGISIVGWQAVTGAHLSKLFPSWPSYIQDINMGFLALTVNIIVSLIVSSFTRNVTGKNDGLTNEKTVENTP